MNKINTCFFSAILISVVSCTSQVGEKVSGANPVKTYPEINKASWFLGNWQNKSPEGIASENWTQVNDSTYSGSSYFVVGKDTVFSESIQLEQRGDKLYYIPTVKDQNGEEPVKFTLTKSSGKQVVFENLKHDFPQKIIYTKIDKDSIVAEISGNMDGKMNSQQFPMSRVK